MSARHVCSVWIVRLDASQMLAVGVRQIVSQTRAVLRGVAIVQVVLVGRVLVVFRTRIVVVAPGRGVVPPAHNAQASVWQHVFRALEAMTTMTTMTMAVQMMDVGARAVVLVVRVEPIVGARVSRTGMMVVMWIRGVQTLMKASG